MRQKDQKRTDADGTRVQLERLARIKRNSLLT